MADVTWLGDEDPSVQSITMYGHSFVKGEPTTVPDRDSFMGKFKGNAFFSVGKGGDVVASDEPESADPDDGTEIAAVRKDLDELGVSYRANASLATLRARLAEALA
jgi:hypothetical protein